MPVSNFRCPNENCGHYSIVVERVFLRDVPSCKSCNATLERDYSLGGMDAAKDRYKRNRVRSPALGSTQLPRRAFDPKSTPEDLMTDLRTGDIYQ